MKQKIILILFFSLLNFHYSMGQPDTIHLIKDLMEVTITTEGNYEATGNTTIKRILHLKKSLLTYNNFDVKIYENKKESLIVLVIKQNNEVIWKIENHSENADFRLENLEVKDKKSVSFL